ncbi:MAG: hypothetical protein H6Q17_1792 [Bacteroidetes bacterium]|jgi:uncharacterized membrane protein|nr:hypothetical protein [Bacteroidota bacterium]
MDVTDFFSLQQKGEIMDAIAEAEKNTSGEIRVHLENYCFGNTLKRATKVFKKLGMANTAQHNGVLFYLAVKSKKLAIVGDSAIHEHVKQQFWDELRSGMLDMFAEDHFKEGLVSGILSAGQKLKEHFPYQSDDVNELPDEISFGKY